MHGHLGAVAICKKIDRLDYIFSIIFQQHESILVVYAYYYHQILYLDDSTGAATLTPRVWGRGIVMT